PLLPPTRSPPFPYTTLFRSPVRGQEQGLRSMRARIVATGSAVPRRVLHNRDLERMVATSDEWIAGRTGIRERRVVDEGVASSDLDRKSTRLNSSHEWISYAV